MPYLTEISERKKLLRGELSKIRREISDFAREELSRALARNLISLAEYADADIVLMYYPIGSEPDVLPIAEDAYKRGKRVAFPLCDTNSHTMTFRYADSLRSLLPGSYSIPEPRADAPEYSPADGRAICIVPGLAADLNGFRLGYGKGFYDRFLCDFTGISVGLFYGCLVRAQGLPHEKTDIPLDIIVTEKEVLAADGAPGKYELARK